MVQISSLRLGCFMCPVISTTTINQNLENGLIDRYAVEIRLLLEKLRDGLRINNPRTKKLGAIYIGDRRCAWDKLSFYFGYLLKHNWIEPSDIITISNILKSDYAYPSTYTKEWIDNQHDLLMGSN
ncbi:MAG: hypothetical protein AB4368_05450 [Xenococcaceae cyanobacterium]